MPKFVQGDKGYLEVSISTMDQLISVCNSHKLNSLSLDTIKGLREKMANELEALK